MIPEQVFILEELVRYLQSDTSGVSPFNSHGAKLERPYAYKLQQGAAISNKSSGETLDVINNWHQLLMRYNSLIMSQKALPTGQLAAEQKTGW